jgi:hypothetical protein
VLADLVAQNRTDVTKATVDDYFNAVDLVMSASGTVTSNGQVWGFRPVGYVAASGGAPGTAGTPTQIWTNSRGSSCGTAPTAASMASLMTQGNDVVVARACTTYSPYLASFLGRQVLGALTFNVSRTITIRPRTTSVLTCWRSTVNGPVCP